MGEKQWMGWTCKEAPCFPITCIRGEKGLTSFETATGGGRGDSHVALSLEECIDLLAQGRKEEAVVVAVSQ